LRERLSLAFDRGWAHDGRSNAVRALLISTIGVATLGLMLAESRTYPLGLRVAGLALGHLDASVTILG